MHITHWLIRFHIHINEIITSSPHAKKIEYFEFDWTGSGIWSCDDDISAVIGVEICFLHLISMAKDFYFEKVDRVQLFCLCYEVNDFLYKVILFTSTTYCVPQAYLISANSKGPS